MIEKNKESQTQSLGELQQELKSLKALLLSRGPTTNLPSSPLPMIGRPAIPPWQLASTPSTPPVAASSPQVNGTSEAASDKGKGVERENSNSES
jgi:peroxin-14